MSFLTKTLRSTSSFNASRALSSSGRRSFHITSIRTALNESDRHKDTSDLHKEIDHHKNDQLQKQKEGKGHWKAELASQSEAALKADSEDLNASEEEIKKLQKETQHHAHETHKDSK